MMQVAFNTAKDLSHAVDTLFNEFPVLLYYRLDSIAPFPGFQSHNGIEMYYIDKGTGNYLVADRVYPLKPGTLMIIRPYTLHKVLQTEVDQMICRSVLMWKEDFMRISWNEDEFPLDYLPTDCCHIQFEPEQHQRIQNIYASIYYELTHKQKSSEAIVHCLIKELMLLSYRAFQDANHCDQLPVQSELPEEISYLVQYIGSNFHLTVSLEMLSRLVHMNPSYLSSLFHKYTGLTIGKFIAVKRIHHAKKLLRETRLSVTDVACQSGFNDTSYFIKTFKNMERITPAIFRKQQITQL